MVDFEAQVRLREVLTKQDYGRAETMIREQIRESRNNPILHWQLAAVLWLGKDDASAALGPIREAARLAPERLEILALAEDVERVLGHQSEADSFKDLLEKSSGQNARKVRWLA